MSGKVTMDFLNFEKPMNTPLNMVRGFREPAKSW